MMTSTNALYLWLLKLILVKHFRESPIVFLIFDVSIFRALQNINFSSSTIKRCFNDEDYEI